MRSSFDGFGGASQSEVTVRVKWYNPTKGFGFVSPIDGGQDAFLHASVLERAGYSELPDGATLVCDLGQGQRGEQVVAIHSVDASTAEPRRAPAARRPFGAAPSGGPSSTVDGRVKFFNAEKGFGFITPEDGSRDVFIHIRTVERSGLMTLERDQAVRVVTSMGHKGPQAESVELL